MAQKTISRRKFLARSAVYGCSLAASPLLTPVSFASAPFENRLVVIVLRGAMDGLDALRPYGDRNFSELRSTLTKGDPRQHDLDGFYGLHPGLSGLMPLWKNGELAFVQAVSTPYRSKRSHFDGQDILEAGVNASENSIRDGWLNRALLGMPGVETQTAFALDRGEMLLMSGDAPVSNWAPETDLLMSPQARRLLEVVVHDDPPFREAFEQALLLSDTDGDPVDFMGDPDDMMQIMRAEQKPGRKAKAHLRVPAYAAEKLRGDTRIAAFSVSGWDTHARQGQVLGRRFQELAEILLALRDGVGADIWSKTTVLAMTEFGRTVRQNGTGGTDHGTGGTMILAGGSVKGGKVYGQWPGLAEADLFERRDLMPTADVRAYSAWAIRAALGLDRAALETRVFPGVDMGQDPGIIL